MGLQMRQEGVHQNKEQDSNFRAFTMSAAITQIMMIVKEILSDAFYIRGQLRDLVLVYIDT